MRAAAIVLMLCAGLLAACADTTLPFSKATEPPPVRTPPAILVSGMSGLSADREAALYGALVNAAALRGIGIGRGRTEFGYALAGEFEETAGQDGPAMRYRWTLTDATGRVLHHIDETQAAGTATDELPVGRIAAYTAESLSSRLSQLGYATRAAGMPPPLDHLAQAGPGAEQEIDFETLNGPGKSGLSDPAAGSAEPVVAGDVPAETASVSKVASGAQAIEGVAVTGVTGAGESGNGELAAALVRVLSDAGWPVQEGPAANVLAIEGDVTVSRPQGNAQKVALRWTVRSPDGKVVGAVEQANDVPAGSLDDGWGDAADHAALAAAQGIFDLVDKLR